MSARTVSISSVLDRFSTYRTGGESSNGVPLPPARLRAGGSHFRDNSAFIDGARRDARRLVEHANLRQESALLDIGCGAGRLAVGILEQLGTVHQYLGIDVNREVVAWAQRHLTRHDPSIRFQYVDVFNDRYNPSGSRRAASSTLPVDDDRFDVIHAYSVFSHMVGADVARYLRETRRVMRPDGVCVFTAFVEQDVPDEEINPTDYGPQAWSGELHCVRFERGHFDAILHGAGLKAHRFEYGDETDGQSLYFVRCLADAPDAS